MQWRSSIYFIVLALFVSPSMAQQSSLMENLAKAPDFQSFRISSYDRSGGNDDRLTSIQPGETRVLAEIEGPGAITHIWNTISAERYYPRMLILRMYWDGEDTPAVEVPLGDFFGVGHGLDRPFQSAAVAVSSEGRARNCYWYMPFHKSARITVTHEGFFPVRAFYYYIDYRRFDTWPDDELYFHAQYRQQTPNPKVEQSGGNKDGRSNYLLLDTQGRGKYAGTVLSAQINRSGWFGEGDDMFFVDGDKTPTMTGTGTEDYFNDAWGFRAFAYPYHGVTLWEGYDIFSRLTAYKWHIYDPVAFQKSLRVTIEHGHANDREDDWYSVAFWYQSLPSPEPPAMASAFDRLPDEGQRYAERLFVNRELALHLQEGRLDEAAKRIDECIAENELADEYGYWSLKKGIVLKRQDQLDEAEDAFKAALQKSDRPKDDRKASECDAERIHELAKNEAETLDNRSKVYLYVVTDWRDEYEIFIDGKSVASGTGGETVREHEVRVSRGNRTVAVRCTNTGGRGGFAMTLVHSRGYAETGDTWKVTNKAEDRWNERRFDDANWKTVEVVGTLGQDDWDAIREPYHFITSVYAPKVIWIPHASEGDKEIYLRKEFRF